ncbi:hypothetical protein psyc5s11_32360 [Clostridium gelidum]|uniref:Uncharacterized protein n=1 Tax=Clostridium gelidum TaxID=704125 RepID=A0ABM7T5D8_9CLOT|nr:hypothetical protein [Clostridium gelidum]BCZ47169.1 hypothetical protein psyc5s11_32360 [Clostridium gelidum]
MKLWKDLKVVRVRLVKKYDRQCVCRISAVNYNTSNYGKVINKDVTLFTYEIDNVLIGLA